MKKETIISFFLVILTFFISFLSYNALPEEIAIHWDINSKVDNYSNKLTGIFLIPFLSLAFIILFLVIPKIDPLRNNIKKFKKQYWIITNSILIFLLYIQVLIILWNLGIRFNIGSFIFIGIGFLFFILGMVIKDTKRNWFVGIRTPWTLSNEIVWKKTHYLASVMFKVIGTSTIFIIIWPHFVFVFLGLLIITIVVLIVYSYLMYEKLKHG